MKNTFPSGCWSGSSNPAAGEVSTLAVLAIIYLWRQRQSKPSPPLTSQPVVWMIVISWILGLSADRFWADWGVAAAIVWMAGEFDQAIPALWSETPCSACWLAGALRCRCSWRQPTIWAAATRPA